MKRIIATISKICELHQVTQIAIKISNSNSSANLNKVISGIKEIAKQRKIKLHPFSTKELKCFNGSFNKKELAESLSLQNPFLAKELAKEQSNRNKYYDKMFIAVGLAKMLYKKLEITPV